MIAPHHIWPLISPKLIVLFNPTSKRFLRFFSEPWTPNNSPSSSSAHCSSLELMPSSALLPRPLWPSHCCPALSEPSPRPLPFLVPWSWPLPLWSLAVSSPSTDSVTMKRSTTNLPDTDITAGGDKLCPLESSPQIPMPCSLSLAPWTPTVAASDWSANWRPVTRPFFKLMRSSFCQSSGKFLSTLFHLPNRPCTLFFSLPRSTPSHLMIDRFIPWHLFFSFGFVVLLLASLPRAIIVRAKSPYSSRNSGYPHGLLILLPCPDWASLVVNAYLFQSSSKRFSLRFLPSCLRKLVRTDILLRPSDLSCSLNCKTRRWLVVVLIRVVAKSLEMNVDPWSEFTKCLLSRNIPGFGSDCLEHPPGIF